MYIIFNFNTTSSPLSFYLPSALFVKASPLQSYSSYYGSLEDLINYVFPSFPFPLSLSYPFSSSTPSAASAI